MLLATLGNSFTLVHHALSLKKTLEDSADLQEFVFVKGVGVFVQPGFSLGKIAQLRCYFDVLARQEEGTVFDSLNQEQIADLLNYQHAWS